METCTYASELNRQHSDADRIRSDLNERKPKVDADANRYNSGRANFSPGKTVQGSVEALRELLGSVTDPLPYAKFAAWLEDRGHPSPPSHSTVRRWMVDGDEPDLRSVWIMAAAVGLTMEQFCGFAKVPAESPGAKSSPILPVPAPAKERKAGGRGR